MANNPRSMDWIVQDWFLQMISDQTNSRIRSSNFRVANNNQPFSNWNPQKMWARNLQQWLASDLHIVIVKIPYSHRNLKNEQQTAWLSMNCQPLLGSHPLPRRYIVRRSNWGVRASAPLRAIQAALAAASSTTAWSGGSSRLIKASHKASRSMAAGADVIGFSTSNLEMWTFPWRVANEWPMSWLFMVDALVIYGQIRGCP